MMTGTTTMTTGNREQGTGNREQGTGNREQGTGNREQGTRNTLSAFSDSCARREVRSVPSYWTRRLAVEPCGPRNNRCWQEYMRGCGEAVAPALISLLLVAGLDMRLANAGDACRWY